jgi:hypothetical protein
LLSIVFCKYRKKEFNLHRLTLSTIYLEQFQVIASKMPENSLADTVQVLKAMAKVIKG